MLHTLVSLACIRAPPRPGVVEFVPGFGKPATKQVAGHLIGNHSCGAYPFFWLAESQSDPKNDPIVFWFNGGPGSSSSYGWFEENGPLQFVKKNCSHMQANPYSWNKFATFVMIDQPAGTGLSFVENASCHAKNEIESTEQLFNAILNFAEALPEYSKQPLYLFGESYAGKYIPRAAARIMEHNQEIQRRGLDSTLINLAGIGLGNSFVSPMDTEGAYPEFAYSHGIISVAQKSHAETMFVHCKNLTETSTKAEGIPSAEADAYCGSIVDWITKVAGYADDEDLRKFDDHDDYNTSLAQPCLDEARMRKELHVDPRVGGYKDKDPVTDKLFSQGAQENIAHLFPPFLASGLRVLIYNGIYDLNCNYFGEDAWLQKLKWSGQEQWNELSLKTWHVDGVMAGHYRTLHNLTQYRIQGAGHASPKDQPHRAQAMFNAFVRNEKMD